MKHTGSAADKKTPRTRVSSRRLFLYLFRYHFCLMFFLAPVAEDNPERAGDEDGRIAATTEADEQGEGEVLRRVAAEEVERKGREHDREDRVQRARQRLENRRVDERIDVAATTEVQLEVLTDAVKDDDGIVDRVTDDRQERCDEGRIDLALRKREYGQHDEDIMHKGKDCRYAETPFEAVSDVEDDQGPRNDKCKHRIGDKLAANRRADFFLTQYLIVSDIGLERSHDILALVFLEVNRADHDVLAHRRIRCRAVFARQLDGRSLKVVFCQARTDLGNRHRLFEFEVDDGTAREVDAEVEAADAHAGNAGGDDDGRKEEEKISMSSQIELIHVSDPPFSKAYSHWRHRRSETLRFSN